VAHSDLSHEESHAEQVNSYQQIDALRAHKSRRAFTSWTLTPCRTDFRPAEFSWYPMTKVSETLEPYFLARVGKHTGIVH
jgi:hypothetical protein